MNMDGSEMATSEDDNNIEWNSVPSGFLTRLKFGILTEEEMKKFASAVIDGANDVTDPRLGMPNLSSQCSTCDSCDPRNCEGHYGMISLPITVYHPYFATEIIQILNKICPGCKCIRQDRKIKGSGLSSKKCTFMNNEAHCKYCSINYRKWYPGRKFKVACKDAFGRRNLLIVAEMNDKFPRKFCSKKINEALPVDYWDFLPKDPCGQNLFMGPNKIILSPYQVFLLLKDLDPKFIEKFVPRQELLFLNSFPVTPNCSRVVEMMTPFSNGCRLTFDECTRAYKRLMDFKKQLNECGQSESDGDVHCIAGHRVLDCLTRSKLRNKTSSSSEDDTSCKSGLRWIKEVLLGKRTDHALRMTVIGDPKLRLGEIGIPEGISEKLLIAEHVNTRNLRKLKKCCNSRVYRMRECYVKSKSGLILLKHRSELQLGDIVYRSLEDGDFILVNRPPSVHQHSLIAFSVKVLPMDSVVAINPLCCGPLLGDFDGDCLHGYIPQSINCRAELKELASLNHQLVNGQDGRNLISLSQDSLTAAYLIMESEVFLNRFQMQQLEMLSPRESHCATILKAPSLKTTLWTGKQLFSMFLPEGLDFNYSLNSVLVRKGDLLSCSADSAWLRNTHNNIIFNMIRHCHCKALDFLSAAQEVLCEWITWRGFSVSLSDIYLSPDSSSRTKMINEVSCGLQEVDKIRYIKQLMLYDFLQHGNRDLDKFYITRLPEWKVAVSSLLTFEAFKEVSSHLYDVIHKYASSRNSMLAMIKAGSKGSPIKLLQQSVCLGLQHSRDFLPFRIPGKLSCALWNLQKLSGDDQKNHDTFECMERHISCSVVESSFLDGLNPLECLIHAVACRGNCFSENADLPGTLTRKLMFYMRDLYLNYDGTVRNAYGNQLIQFSYGVSVDTPNDDYKSHRFLYERTLECDGHGGQPVGAWSACSISEAAYGALDQPISMHETSPLINLKKVLDCSRKETSVDHTASIFLSKKLRRWTYGLEYGALEVKSHLEAVFLSDVVTAVSIIFEPDIGDAHSPWVLHFHLHKDEMKNRRLTIGSLINALSKNLKSQETGTSDFPILQILSRDCSLGDRQDEQNGELCIAVAAECSDDSTLLLDTLRDVVIPSLLSTVIKGFQEFKKVEILWEDPPKTSKFCPGELFLKVSVLGNCAGAKLWSTVQSACSQIMDLIDWERSRPDHVYDIFHAFGIDAAWRHFLETLKSTITNIGREIHLEHLVLLADCLSITGEFHGLNLKGIKHQRDQISISSPFMQACFSKPSDCFIKAAKEGAADDLLGTLDTIAWGKEAPMGTGGPFEIFYSGKGKDLDKPLGIYDTLCNQLTSRGDKVEIKGPGFKIFTARGCKSSLIYDNANSEEQMDLEHKSISVQRLLKADIKDMLILLQNILHKYPVNACVTEEEKSLLMKALCYHPEGNIKMVGAQKIKIGHNPLYNDSRSRCFILVKEDGTLEDFSYRKCIVGAARHISPKFAAWFRNKVFRNMKN